MRWEREPWVKLYRREVGSFALLPLYARALAAELLKFADEAGRLYVGAREPWEAIAKLCGATTGDRRLLRQHIPMLIRDGYLVRDGEHLVIKNLTAAQRRRAKTEEPEEPSEPQGGDGQEGAGSDANEERTGTSGERTGNEPETNRERTVNEPARVVNELETKREPSARNHSDEPLAGARASEREEEKREEEKREAAAAAPQAGAGTHSSASATFALSPPSPKKQKKPSPPPTDIALEQLTETERRVRQAILDDPSLARICPLPGVLARDLVKMAEGEDVVRIVIDAGAFTRTEAGRKNGYSDGSKFLQNQIQRARRIKKRDSDIGFPNSGTRQRAPSSSTQQTPPPEERLYRSAGGID